MFEFQERLIEEALRFRHCAFDIPPVPAKRLCVFDRKDKMDLDERAIAAIDQVFKDTSVDQDETLRRLQALREHIEILMDSIQ